MTKEWFDLVSSTGLGWRTSKEATYDIAVLAMHHNVPGDFVETGVYAGCSVALMAKAIMDYEEKHGPTGRHVHAFDSFKGLPAPGEHDVQMVKGGASCPIDHMQNNMRRFGIREDLIIYHPGWFHETLPVATCGVLPREQDNVRAIAVLRLDGDLYSSTAEVLDYLQNFCSTGAWVIVDDFDLPGCRKAVLERIAPAPIYFRVHEEAKTQ
jgi:O-methyltransferase